MKIGVTFPQTEIGSDPAMLRDYAQTAEDLGYDHILAYDHVLGAQPGDHRPGWSGPYNYQSTFHEPLVLFAYMGAVTSRIEFVTGVLILPQRQTALVAKQAAEVDILTDQRLRLGVANGWNAVEFESLNEDFHNRGRRIEEQIEVMRRLWTEEVVTFKGKWHTLDHVAIAPRPRRLIPVWFGGMSDAAMRRAARVGDGWYPQLRPSDGDPREVLDRFRSYVREFGRRPDDLGLQTTAAIANATPDALSRRLEELEALGITHVCINTMNAGLSGPRDHIDAIRRYKEETGR
jgi:probable F420-dependent oxidoreductase